MIYMDKIIIVVFTITLIFTPLLILQSFGESEDIFLKNPEEGVLSDFIYIENNTVGFSSREISQAYSLANGDVEEAIKILQDPNYPKNILDPVLKAYEDLNNRLAVDLEFKKLMEIEVVGFGIDEPNDAIFIVVDPMYANQENFDKYEEILRETIGDDILITFEVNERANSIDKEDFDSRILLILLVVPVVFVVVFVYFKKKNKVFR